MSRTVSYDSITDGIAALSGVDTFTQDELAWIKSRINSRLREAYQKSYWWPDYLVIGEPRPVIDGLVPLVNPQEVYTNLALGYRYYGVKNAQKEQFNQAYVHLSQFPGFTKNTGIFATAELWVPAEIDKNTTNEEVIFSKPVSILQSNGMHTANVSSVFDISAGDWLYGSSSTNVAKDQPPEDSTYIERSIKSERISPTVFAIQDVDTMLRVYSKNYYRNEGAYEYQFATESDNVRLLGAAGEYGTVYCTYQKRFTPNFDTGSNVPYVWSEFVTHAVYADRLRSQGQNDTAAMERNFAMSRLDDELFRMEQAQSSNVTSKFTTYTSRGRVLPTNYY